MSDDRDCREGAGNRDDCGRCRVYGKNRERAYPIEGELDLEKSGVLAFFGTLADGGSRV